MFSIVQIKLDTENIDSRGEASNPHHKDPHFNIDTVKLALSKIGQTKIIYEARQAAPLSELLSTNSPAFESSSVEFIDENGGGPDDQALSEPRRVICHRLARLPPCSVNYEPSYLNFVFVAFRSRTPLIPAAWSIEAFRQGRVGNFRKVQVCDQGYFTGRPRSASVDCGPEEPHPPEPPSDGPQMAPDVPSGAITFWIRLLVLAVLIGCNAVA